MKFDYLAAPLSALKAGDAARAIRMLNEILVVHPEIVETSYHLARAYEMAGDLDQARTAYAEVVADGSHTFFNHARNRLNEIGAPDAAQAAAPAVEEEPSEYAEVVQTPHPAPVAEAPAPEAAPPEAAPPEAAPPEAPAEPSEYDAATQAGEPAAAEPAAVEPAAADEAAADEAAADDSDGSQAAADSSPKGGKRKKGGK